MRTLHERGSQTWALLMRIKQRKHLPALTQQQRRVYHAERPSAALSVHYCLQRGYQPQPVDTPILISVL